MERVIIPLNIQDLPEEIFEIIAQFLSDKDLDACFNVCKTWRRILNTDKVWERCCVYREEFFKASLTRVNNTVKNQELCKWRICYQLQKGLWENWKKGEFVKEKLNIHPQHFNCLETFIDEHGNHWLFVGHEGITVWNISATPVVQSKIFQSDHFGIWPTKDKLLTFRSNYVKVFQFKPPEFELKLQYRFKFDNNDVLGENVFVSEDDYACGMRYIFVDNFFIGYNENITNLRSTSFHIWDLDSGKKLATHSVFQQSFVEFIQSARGADVTREFYGGLLLFAGDNGRFLVNVIDDRFKLCQISLFNLAQMRFTNVVAQLNSRTGWCFMKREIAVIYHTRGEDSSLLSVYNVNGILLTTLNFPGHYNPAFNDEFWFNGLKIILKIKTNIHVVNIIDSLKVRKCNFKLDKERYILTFFEPKYLVLFDKRTKSHPFSPPTTVSVWDVESGVKLWKLKKLACLGNFRRVFNTEYPGRLVVQFKGDIEMTILNFEKYVEEELHVKNKGKNHVAL